MLTVRSILAATLIISLFVPVQISFADTDTRIAFRSSRVDNPDVNPDIYVLEGTRRNEIRITMHPASDKSPTWSPDGDKIAFVSDRNNRRNQIWVIDADGKNPVRLTDGFDDDNPDWSPDGTTIAYHTQRKKESDYPFGVPLFELYLMDSDGSNQRQLVGEDSIEPCWSPGGTRIVFLFSRKLGELPQLHVVDSDGANMRKLTHNIGETYSPAWSPDGSSIAYQHNFQLWIMDSNGENKRQLTKRSKRQVIDSDPTWSPDSKHIAFDSNRKGERTKMFLVSVKGGFVNQLLPPHQNINNQADWYHPGPLSVSPVDTKVTIWGRLKSGK